MNVKLQISWHKLSLHGVTCRYICITQKHHIWLTICVEAALKKVSYKNEKCLSLRTWEKQEKGNID